MTKVEVRIWHFVVGIFWGLVLGGAVVMIIEKVIS